MSREQDIRGSAGAGGMPQALAPAPGAGTFVDADVAMQVDDLHEPVLADAIEALLAREPDGAPCRTLALQLRRQKAIVLATLRHDPRFAQTGRNRQSRWRLIASDGRFDVEEQWEAARRCFPDSEPFPAARDAQTAGEVARIAGECGRQRRAGGRPDAASSGATAGGDDARE